MEEIDNIIINTLKHLNCSIDDDIRCLKQFDNHLVVRAMMSCIDVISPGTGLQHSMPSSMSQRLKLATNIADQIKEIGFRGDIGYQMILYGNEVEIRRLLMFLIEKLPRETDKAVHSKDTSRMSTLVKTIKLSLNKSLKAIWLPNELLRSGIRQTQGFSFNINYGSCFPLECKSLFIPNTQENYSEEMKQYCVHNLADVTKQCPYKNLIPSLLFNNLNNQEMNDNYVKEIIKKAEESNKSRKENNFQEDESTEILSESENEKVPSTLCPIRNSISDQVNLIEKYKEEIVNLQNQLKTLESKKLQLSEYLITKEKDLNINLQNLNIKSKSSVLLSNKENIEKLKLVVENGSQKLVELTNQWHKVQEPLLQEYRSIREKLNFTESEAQEMQEKFQNMKQKCRKANEELKEKDQLLAQLTDQYSKLTKQTNRSAYTERIDEIIANIHKQHDDIIKILKDTVDIQKEINTLSGQLERSFALAEEVIFRNAKQDETARESYKLLASMHNEYDEVIRISSELGAIIRETRNIQEQVDTEEAREVGARLSRVVADLNQLRSEAATLKQETITNNNNNNN